MGRRGMRRWRAAATVAAMAAAPLGMAATVERTWTTGSGSFATASNWSPRGVPDSDDIATFNTGGLLATVTMPAANVDNLRLRILQGTITINTSEFVYCLNGADALLPGGQIDVESSSIQVGWNTPGTSTLIIDGAGTLRGVSLTAGAAAGSIGQVIVRNQTTWLRLDSTLLLSAAGQGALTVQQMADVTAPRLLMSHAGPSSLNITTGGTAQFSEAVEVGRAGQATVNVTTGGQMIWNRGELGAMTGGTGAVTIRDAGSAWIVSQDVSIGRAGTGTAIVRDGASATVGRDMFIASEPGSSGQMTVQDAGSQLTVQRNLLVGGSSISAGGSGTLTIGPGTEVAVAGNIETWTGGRIELHGGTVRAGLLWQRGAGGTFDWTGGLLHVTGGELWVAPGGFFGSSMTVSGEQVLRVDGDIDVYSALGTAEMTLAGGGQVAARSAFLGSFEDESGVVNVSGTGSMLVLDEALYIGGGEMAAGGAGALNVGAGGFVDAGELLQVWDGGSVNLSGGQILADELLLHGSAAVSGGSLSIASPIQVVNGGVLQYAGGTISTPQLRLQAEGRLAMAAGGDRVLTITMPEIDTTGGSVIDVADNRLVVQQGDVNEVRELVKLGYAGGAWTGPGIASSVAAVEAGRALGIGVGGDDVIVRFTWAGDATLDGAVTIADLGVLAANWQGTGKGWWEGDYNYDGVVNIADLGILASNWQRGVGSGPAGSGSSFEEALGMFDAFSGVVVPEPGVGWFALGVLGLAVRRRRAGVESDE
jgi:T5SS/PEP-CTERM-associated repeat protein